MRQDRAAQFGIACPCGTQPDRAAPWDFTPHYPLGLDMTERRCEMRSDQTILSGGI